MAGYAFPVGATNADKGTSGSTTVALTSTSLTTIFTATKKTKINTILLTNTFGTIVPVVLVINNGTDKPLTTARVLKNRYVVQPLITGDPRIDDGVYDAPILTEVYLNTGDILKASCRIEDIITVNVAYTEGVN
jgi:hypothetical protein